MFSNKILFKLNVVGPLD